MAVGLRSVGARRLLAASLLLVGAQSACAPGPSPVFGPSIERPLPEPDSVEGVVFLVGDAGAATEGTSPLLADLAARVADWAERAPADSAITVAFLGDNVYPLGIRDRSHRRFAEDSVRLWSQIEVLQGPAARAGAVRGLFLPGNHDWGERSGAPGIARLRNQAAMLRSARAAGTPVQMSPEAGEPGPDVYDVGTGLRLITIDSEWYLQSRDDAGRRAVMDRLRQAMAEAEGRHVALLTHHPFQSAGPHGLLAQRGKALGLPSLMRRAGALIQDLNAVPYQDFLEELRGVFSAVGRPPLVFAAGHDHSLQVIDPEGPHDPATILVSGAGSKVTDVAPTDILRFAAATPGYMMLVLRAGGRIDLFVLAAASGRPACPASPDAARRACMESPDVALDLVYSERLADGPPGAEAPGG